MKNAYFKYLVFISFCMSTSISSALQCSQIVPNNQTLYSAKHFPQSVMWLGEVNSDFAKWSAAQSNKVANMFTSGAHAQKVLDTVAEARKQFEAKVTYIDGNNEDRSGSIGVLREQTDQLWSTLLWLKHHFDSPGRAAIADWVFRQQPMLRMKSAVRGYYMFLDRTSVIDSTGFVYSQEQGLNIVHPSGADAVLIMADTMKRIEKFQQTKELSDFAGAMQGYFNAMPYKGGSASIGRVFFSGLFMSVFDKPVTIHQDIDILAMTMDQNSFATVVSKQISDQFEN